ncbi:MAG: TetR/AcrR family transcriptional regulator [Deltaproteobacteria bacterium]|jgi:TetR/AcrR family transcriptional regulator|nr:TetR/AcrR family transcriptional regulator [Deltaproteobacteria bacterium]
MSTTRRPTAERREEIADAALRIIESHGIVALSTAALSKAVGLTSGALFRHFPSFDAILDEVARRAEALLRATLPDPALPPEQRLERFMDARAAIAGKHAGVLRLMTSDQFTMALPAAAKRRLRAAIGDTRASVAQTLADGQKSGIFRDDLPAEDLAVIVLGTLKMIAFSAAAGVADHNEEARRVRTTLRALLSPPAARAARR